MEIRHVQINPPQSPIYTPREWALDNSFVQNKRPKRNNDNRERPAGKPTVVCGSDATKQKQ
jgi:hypothetical protein